MAVTVLTNAYIELNGVDESSNFHSVTMPRSIAELDATVFSSDATTIHEPGLKSFSMSFDFRNDYTDDAFDEKMHALWNGRTKFTVKVRPSADAIGAGNPSYEYTGFISDMEDGGEVGSLAGGSMTVPNTTALTRAVA